MISAAASMERIYGYLMNTKRGSGMLDDWKRARAGLDTLADYKQVVSRLASAAATLADPESESAKVSARKEVVDCVMRLQSIRSDM